MAIKRRSTKAELAERQATVFEICRRDQPLTIRNAYYQAVTLGAVDKNGSGARKVQRDILDMRRSGRLPYSWIVDSSRIRYSPRVFDGLEAALSNTASFYRRDLWSMSHKRVEVWCESGSIAGVIRQTCSDWAVELFPCKGQPSESFVWSAGQDSEADGRPLVVLYLGDLDPAGFEIERATVEKLRRFAPSIDVAWRRLGVTIDQVEDLGLIGKGTRPKKQADWFPYSEAFECEAIPAPQMRALVVDAIGEHADPHQLAVLTAAEESEREILTKLARQVR